MEPHKFQGRRLRIQTECCEPKLQDRDELTGAGNGWNPMCVPAHPGCCKVAPLWPHLVQRARCRSRSLDVSAPHRIMSGARAIGACHFSQ